MFGKRGLILISLFICVLLKGCQQLPYRDVIHQVDPQQPECDYIIDDGFDERCVKHINIVDVVEKIVYQDRIVYQEKIVYEDRIVYQDRIVYIEVPVEVEKIVYEDRIVYEDEDRL